MTNQEATTLCGGSALDLSSPETVSAIKAESARLIAELFRKKLQAYNECVKNCASIIFDSTGLVTDDVQGGGSSTTTHESGGEIEELIPICQQKCAQS